MMEINSKNLQKEKHKSGPSYYENLKLSVSSLLHQNIPMKCDHSAEESISLPCTFVSSLSKFILVSFLVYFLLGLHISFYVYASFLSSLVFD